LTCDSALECKSKV